MAFAGRRIAIVATPIVAIATLALGLRVGARDTVHAAIVHGAPKARGSDAFAWQLVTIVDDRGVRETEPLHGVTVRARDAASGREATWSGDTNADGVAEIRLEMPGIDRGAPIDLEVRAPAFPEPLARGRVAWGDGAWMERATGMFVRPSRREGAIALDVAVLGGRLIPGHPVPIAVRATARDDGHPLGGLAIAGEPEPGFDVSPPTATTCPLGWARFAGSPVMQVASLSLHARAQDGSTGDWFGTFPVAAGAVLATPSGDARATRIDLAATAARTVYVEIDDDRGRAFGLVRDLAPTPLGPRASSGDLALAPGLWWAVASGEPRGAESLGGATIARPFVAQGSPMPIGAPIPGDACAELAYLALHPAGGFARFVAIDGFAGRAAAIAAKRKKGLGIALGSLAVASLLELLLLLDAAARARADVRRAASALEGEDAAVLVRRSGAGSVLIGLLVALLGFGLLAAMLLWKT